jgi:hypothetical protein
MTENIENPFIPNAVASDLRVGDFFYTEERKRQSGWVNRFYVTYNSYRVDSIQVQASGSLLFQLTSSAGHKTAKSYRAAFAKIEKFTPSAEAQSILWK